MSILLYKQRFRHPNKKDTAGANYAHVRYICTRHGALKNAGMNHGLFGKLEPGNIEEFDDWHSVARRVYANSKKGIVMYRSVISFTEETAKDLLLLEQKDWQRYIENHIMTIAEKNNIRREHLQWAAAVHGEKRHPHIHVIFWDTSARVRNPFTAPQIPDAIRRQMIKDTFSEKILLFAREKDRAVKEMRQITDELVKQFENNLRFGYSGKSKAAEKMLEKELEDIFSKKVLLEVAQRLFSLKESMPEQGRIAYQLLEAEQKKKTDETVQFLLREIPEIRDCYERYAESKCRMAALYTSEESLLKAQKKQFEKEAEKILANRVLSGVKMLLRLESEERSADYINSRKEYFAEKIILEALDMLAQAAWKQEDDYRCFKNMAGELSKEARKEFVIKNRDKGYEH